MEKITINHIPLQVKEYNGQRVVTFKDIDSVHQRPNGTAGRNFRTNRKHFIEGEDFYKITPDEFRRTIGNMDSRQSNDVTLLTESGYLMLVKSFTDELAWSVQRQLVNSYFRLKAVCKQLSFEDEPEYEYFDKTYNGIPVLTVRDISHITGAKKQNILWYLANKCVKKTDYCVLRAETMETFKKENPKFSKKIACLTIVAKSGFLKLCEAMGIKCNVPKCYCIEEKKRPELEIVEKILHDFAIRKGWLTKENGNIFLGEDTITGNSVIFHDLSGENKIFYDNTSDYYEKLAIIMKNIGQLLLGKFRKSIDGKPICTNEIDEEARVFSATFLALKLFADYGGFDTNKN